MNGIANLTPDATNVSNWSKGWKIFNPGNNISPMSDYITANGSSRTLAQIVSSKDMINIMRPSYTMDSARISVGIYYNSRSHPFITDLEPGFTRYEIRPQLADLPDLALEVQAPRGPIGFSGKGLLGKRTINLTLPPNAEGEMVVHPDEKLKLKPLGIGGNEFYSS